MTPEELLVEALKQSKKIVFGNTIGTDSNGNCTVQGKDGSVLARSPDQISAGSAIALKTDDGQWYAVSARQTGTVNKKSLFKRKSKPETKVETTANVKILFRVGNDIFVGGDRETPEQIYTIPDGFEVEKANISASGLEADDWVAQIVLRSTAVMDAYRLSQLGETTLEKETNSFFLFYLNNRSTFVDSLRLITIDPSSTKEIKDTGIKVSRGTTIPKFLFTSEKLLVGSGPMEGYPPYGALNFFVKETYEVDTSRWVLTPINRTCDIIGYRGFLYQTPLVAGTKAIAETIRLTLLAEASPVRLWKTLSDAGLGNTYEGFAFIISSYGVDVGEWLLLNVEIAGFGWWYSFDAVSLSSPTEPEGSRSAEPYIWRDGEGRGYREEVSFFAGLSMSAESFFSYSLSAGVYWLGFFCGFDGKLNNDFLPLTIKNLSLSSQVDLSSIPYEQSSVNVNISVSPSRSFPYIAWITFNSSNNPYIYPVLSIGSPFPISPYTVYSYQSKDSYILQGAGEETQLIKNNANSTGQSQLFDLYTGGETKIVATPFRAQQLNGDTVFGSFALLLDELTLDVQGYKLDGIVIPPEIVSNGITPKVQPVKSIDDNDLVVIGASTFLDLDSYNELPDA